MVQSRQTEWSAGQTRGRARGAGLQPKPRSVERTTAGPFRVQLVDSYAGLVALRSEWCELEEQVGTDLPFQTWEWTVAWWNHLQEAGGVVRDHLRIFVIR